MQKHITPDAAESLAPLLPRPYASNMRDYFGRRARWVQETYGGPLVVMSAATRHQLKLLDMNANAPAGADTTRFGIMGLLESIAMHGAMLRERGRQAFDLPAEAREVLLGYLWGKPTDPDTLRRAVAASVELETRLTWRYLAMPMAYPDGDPFALGIFERMNGWR